MSDAPEGFAPHPRKSPLTDPWEPLYSRETESAIIIGVRVREPHCNARGLAHGGLISALADNALGLSCARRHDPPAGLVTTSLHVEFLRAAKLGQWLEFKPTFTKIGRTIDFAQGHVEADGERCALVSAAFAVQPRG